MIPTQQQPETMTFARSVSIRDQVVVKAQEPLASRKERLRTLAGNRVGQETGLFLVPEIVSFDDARGEIVFERLQLTKLREILSDRDRGMEALGRAAQVLAAIHGRMQPGEGARRTVAGALGASSRRDVVPLHGDFVVFNILLVPASDRMVVIDWANADWIGIDADLGAPEIDIAVFLISLFHRRAFGPWPVAGRHEVARHFLTAYESASPCGLDLGCLRAIVAAVTPKFIHQTRQSRGKLRALGYRHGMLDLDLFLRRLG
jgi:hypothetical protein